MGKAKRIHFPKTRLAELVARAGGMPRDLALESAQKSLESMRGQSDSEIAKSIAAMETIVFAPTNRGKLNRDQLLNVLCAADQVVTLAGLFGYADLDAAARSLCDVADGLLNAGLSDLDPVAVHVQALHLIAPTAVALSNESRATILSELAKVVTHYNFSSIGGTATLADEGPPGAAAE